MGLCHHENTRASEMLFGVYMLKRGELRYQGGGIGIERPRTEGGARGDVSPSMPEASEGVDVGRAFREEEVHCPLGVAEHDRWKSGYAVEDRVLHPKT